MYDLESTFDLIRHQVHHLLSVGRRPSVGGSDPREPARDPGAVSLEQVLWFVAAGVSVAVIAGLIWSQIREQANTPVLPPSAP